MVQAERKIRALHRSRIEIIANILRAAEGGAKKTHIMYRCNLSFRQLHAYLDLLIERGLLCSVAPKRRERKNSHIYKTTDKGKAFIQAYHVIGAILSS